MKKPKIIPIAEYDYPLTRDRIARYPLINRDDSKLLLYDGKNISNYQFKQLPNLLKSTDKLFFNVTKVVQARMIFFKPTGGRIEIFILEPLEPSDHQLAFSSTDPVEFECLVGNARNWKTGDVILKSKEMVLTARKISKNEGSYRIRFSWENTNLSFAEVLESAGSTPIPPYLDRVAEESDTINYQTVYAKEDGSVAAPTAGLHFTERVLEKLDQKGIGRYKLTLHVGAGTFIPVKDENAADHSMHSEFVRVDKALLNALLKGDGRNIVVGTTSARTIESLYWIGVKALSESDFSFSEIFLDQWEAYGLNEDYSRGQVLENLLNQMEKNDVESFNFRTRIMITPGYEFKLIDGVITNFHQPKSTLLLLISAIVGEDWKKIYKHALENDFRFLSYGDSSLLLRK